MRATPRRCSVWVPYFSGRRARPARSRDGLDGRVLRLRQGQRPGLDDLVPQLVVRDLAGLRGEAPVHARPQRFHVRHRLSSRSAGPFGAPWRQRPRSGPAKPAAPRPTVMVVTGAGRCPRGRRRAPPSSLQRRPPGWPSGQDGSFDVLICGKGLSPWIEDAWRVARPGAVLLMLAPDCSGGSPPATPPAGPWRHPEGRPPARAPAARAGLPGAPGPGSLPARAAAGPGRRRSRGRRRPAPAGESLRPCTASAAAVLRMAVWYWW